jgi:hypothetical protein
MTNTPHDRFAKNYLKELLSPLGEVTIGRKILDETNEIDVFFSPNPSAVAAAKSIGLLSKLVTINSSIEIFRNQPDVFQVLMCMKKLYMYFAELNREANRKDVSFNVAGKGNLLIITTTASKTLLDGFGATINSDINCNGIYSLHETLFVSIIAVNQLPVINETLWLRVLGKGKVQRNAVDELLVLPDTNAYKQNTLRMLANLRIVIIEQTNLSDENQEDVMQLSTAYLEWEQKTLNQGREEGREAGREEGELKGEQKLVIKLLNRRIGELEPPAVEQIRKLPVEQLEELAEALLNFSTVANLEEWLKARPIATQESQPVES